MSKTVDAKNEASEGEVWPPSIMYPAVPVAEKANKALLRVCWRKTFFALSYLALLGVALWLGAENGYYRLPHPNKLGICFTLLTLVASFIWSWEAIRAWLLFGAGNRR